MSPTPLSKRPQAGPTGHGALSRAAVTLALILLTALLVVALATVGTAHALRAPRPLSPGNGTRVQQLPAITWSAVRGAAAYEYQISGDSRFRSIALGRGKGRGTAQIHNLAAALEKQVSDGAYYWRVRALTHRDRTGPWSKVRRIVKRWTQAPSLTGGNGVTVNWPSTPLVLRWSSVPYAAKYIVKIATDEHVANLVLGTATKPVYTQGVNFAMPSSLAPGQRYYWAITPVDAEGHRGKQSGVGSFVWAWPTTTATNVADLNPSFGAFDDPLFSWNAVPGAARYEVEINASQDFPAGSKWCCAGSTTATSLAPLQVLANNHYYWRVRALDARGNAGVWNYGPQFDKTFDPGTINPATKRLDTVQNVTVRDVGGEALEGVPATDTPIVTWDPVPGAARYEVQIGVYEEGLGCDWSLATRGISPTEPTTAFKAFTSTTAWTPLGVNVAGHQGPTAWPKPQATIVGRLPTKVTYCFRVLARSGDDAQHGQVISAWTPINGANQPAFTYADPPPAGEPGPEGLVTEASDYLLPNASVPSEPGKVPCEGQSGPANVCRRTPLFTWERVPGANGYFVVISRDARFTEVADVGFTNVPAYAPRLANESPLADENTTYYWAVVPTAEPNGFGVFSTPCYATPVIVCGSDNDNPHAFNQSSVPPAPLAPGNGGAIATQPVFRWSPAENARSYRFQVSQDPTFRTLIDDVTTAATAYASSSTYPADTALYWRVRANDWIGQGLNWSTTQQLTRTLPAPVPAPFTPSDSIASTPLSWSSVTGAVSYDIHVDQPDGKTSDFSFEAPSASVTEYYGTGYAHWKVRAEFPTSIPGAKVPGPYFEPPQAGLLTLPAPSGARGVKSGSRFLVSWRPQKDAKRYRVEVSKTNGFASRIEYRTVDGTSWAPNIDLSRKVNRGTLYWRVAPVDVRNNVGSFASGNFGGKKRHAKKRRHRR
jgi:hypothetical protein